MEASNSQCEGMQKGSNKVILSASYKMVISHNSSSLFLLAQIMLSLLYCLVVLSDHVDSWTFGYMKPLKLWICNFSGQLQDAHYMTIQQIKK